MKERIDNKSRWDNHEWSLASWKYRENSPRKTVTNEWEDRQ